MPCSSLQTDFLERTPGRCERREAKSVDELKALGEVGHGVSSTLDLQTVLSTTVRHAVQLSATDCGIIYEYDEPTQEFHLRVSYQMKEELVRAYQATPLRLGQGLPVEQPKQSTHIDTDLILDEVTRAMDNMVIHSQSSAVKTQWHRPIIPDSATFPGTHSPNILVPAKLITCR